MSNWATMPHLTERSTRRARATTRGSWWAEAEQDGFTDRAAKHTQLPDSRTVEGRPAVQRIRTQFNGPRDAD
jgi:hypothetical protein